MSGGMASVRPGSVSTGADVFMQQAPAWRPFDDHNATQALARMIAADPDHPTDAELADADECRVILANFWAEWRRVFIEPRTDVAKDGDPP